MSFDVVSLIIGAFLGGLPSWLITHVYHRKSSRDLREKFDRLPDDIQQAAATSNLPKLTVHDLNAVLRSRVVDTNSLSGFPYKACPRCGSEELRTATVFHSADIEADEEGGANYIPIHCPQVSCLECGWSENAIDGPEPTYLEQEE